MKFEKIPVDDFIKNHTYINYCEAIIFPDGDVSYASPSHTMALIKVTGKTEHEIYYEEMSIHDSPIDWLMERTGCICIWSDGIMSPRNITDEQVTSLKALVIEGLTKINYYR